MSKTAEEEAQAYVAKALGDGPGATSHTLRLLAYDLVLPLIRRDRLADVELVEVLHELYGFLDRYADVDDDQPNDAMALLTKVSRWIDVLEVK